MMPHPRLGPLACDLLRRLAYVWRFRDLRLAEFIHHHSAEGQVLERPFFGYRLMLDVSRTSYHALLYLRGERAIDERNILSSVIHPGARVLDIGANIGYYALMFARMAGATGSVDCFEPEPNNARELKRNIGHNDLKQVSVCEMAVGSAARRVGIEAGMNGHVLEAGPADKIVEMCTLDDCVKDQVNFIKIDVEGYEWEVLKGAQKIVSQWKPVLFIEVHPHLLPSNSSVAGIMHYLKSHYAQIECYEERHGTRGQRLLERYLNRGRIRRVRNAAHLLSEMATGTRKDRFWVLCMPSRDQL